MLQTAMAYGGMVVAPHHLAARAGSRVLEEGGNAIEAMVAAAAAIAVCYPHMNALGGDNFWLMAEPGEGAPLAIDACGGAAALADVSYYRKQGHETIPSRGPLAALTVAGAVGGWAAALETSRERWGGRLGLDRLLEDAIHFARAGVAVTGTLSDNSLAKEAELKDLPGFAGVFRPEGRAPRRGERLRLAALADTLEWLGREGPESFYRGDLARSIAADLERAGSPLRLSDLERYRAIRPEPLSTTVSGHRVYNMTPPTQGLASLLLLGVYDRLGVKESEGFDFIHGLVESTKAAFRVRDAYVCDPDYMAVPAGDFLTAERMDEMAAGIDRKRAAPWPDPAKPGDTVWLGAIDGEGRAVSFIQSLYWEFGSGVVLPETGIVWQNRGTSFSLDEDHFNCLKPGRRPFHTIQPAMAKLSDGRLMPYGTMGGEGQPQTQAMVFTRHVLYGQGLQEAVTAPRWLLGRTWGSQATNLRMESRFDPALVAALREAGHDVELVGPFEEVMGHAGALVHHPDGLIEGASDPRSDGAVVGF